jgi:hypothetical protein
MPDKRNYRRFNLENNIFLKFESNPEKIIEGKLLDISFVGLSIFLKESVNVDVIAQTMVQFDFLSFAEQHLIGKGKVVHVEKYRLYAQDGFRTGLEFIEVDKEIVIGIINRAEAKNLEQIRKQSQKPGKNPDLY